MIGVFVIFLFLFISWCYGFTTLRIFKAKREKSSFYQFFADLAVGLAVFSFIGVFFNTLRIPLHIITYTVVAIIYPVYYLLRNGSFSLSGSKKEAIIFVSVLVMAAVIFGVFYKGAFSYPYLEDDDSWSHATATQYVASQMTYNQHGFFEKTGILISGYLEPYPPTFDVLLGVFRQIHPSLIWVMKSINALLCSLAIIFSFLFAREFFKSDEKGLLAAFFLAVTPAFMSHFIFSQTLAIAVMMVSLYALMKVIEHKSWFWPSIIVFASMMVTQPMISASFGVAMILIFVFKLFFDILGSRKPLFKRIKKDTLRVFLSGVLGLLLSMVYWLQELFLFGFKNFLKLKGGELKMGSGWLSSYSLVKYSIKDFFIAKSVSRMDQPTGLGWFFAFLFVIALLIYLVRVGKLFKKRDWRRLFLLSWAAGMLYVLFSVNFIPLPGPHRSWVVMIIPVTLITVDVLINNLVQFSPVVRYFALAIIIFLVLFSSGVPKYKVNTSQWPPGVSWTSSDELNGYLSLRGMGLMTVLPLCSDDSRVIAMGHKAFPWIPEEYLLKRKLSSLPAGDIISFMEKYGYDHLIIDSSCLKFLGANETSNLAKRLSDSKSFMVVKQNKGFLLAKKVLL